MEKDGPGNRRGLPKTSQMKIALVYDRINKFGGAERLLLSLHRLYPEAPVFTLVHEPKTSKWAEGIKVIPTFVNKIPFLRKKHEWLAPIAPLAFETHDLSEFEIIISLTSSDAKSVMTKPDQLHICYCLTPTRYFWSGEAQYRLDKKYKFLPDKVKDYFKRVDLATSGRPDEYLSISDEVKNRVKKYYNRVSRVIYPSIEQKFYSDSPFSLDNRDYYLIVSRLVPYKKVDLAISAFNKLKLPLIVIGSGGELQNLRKIAGPNIAFVGEVDDYRLIQYYAHAKAVIFPQEEDFGLVPIEAQASGTPVIAYAKGGALETVIHMETGYLFPEQTADSLIEAVKKFEKIVYSPDKCIHNASRFKPTSFAEQFSREVEKLWQKHLRSR
jgi:glycosyltransferase involved in cell wall biosynthesis